MAGLLLIEKTGFKGGGDLSGFKLYSPMEREAGCNASAEKPPGKFGLAPQMASEVDDRAQRKVRLVLLV